MERLFCLLFIKVFHSSLRLYFFTFWVEKWSLGGCFLSLLNIKKCTIWSSFYRWNRLWLNLDLPAQGRPCLHLYVPTNMSHHPEMHLTLPMQESELKIIVMFGHFHVQSVHIFLYQQEYGVLVKLSRNFENVWCRAQSIFMVRGNKTYCNTLVPAASSHLILSIHIWYNTARSNLKAKKI